MQDRSYADQLAVKQAALLSLWGEALPEQVRQAYSVIPSPEPFGYRLRMDYVCSDDRFGLRQRKRFFAVLDLQECHLIPPSLFAKVRDVYSFIRSLGVPDYNVYHNTGFLRYLVVRRNVRDEWLLAFVTSEHNYHGELEQAALYALRQGATSVWWLHNPRHADTSFGSAFGHWGQQYLPQYVAGKRFTIGPNTFFQNNVLGFEEILAFCRPYVAGARRLVDLYAGVGTIGIALGAEVEQVVGVELVSESIELLHLNAGLNEMSERLTIMPGDVAEVLASFSWVPGDIAILDPPRAGLLPPVCAQLNKEGPSRIVYISCNPVTQIDDVNLLPNYRIVAARGFDLFPQTFHSENVVVLERSGSASS